MKIGTLTPILTGLFFRIFMGQGSLKHFFSENKKCFHQIHEIKVGHLIRFTSILRLRLLMDDYRKEENVIFIS